MMRLLPVPLLFLAGCGQKLGFQPPPDDSVADTQDTSPHDTGPDDTADTDDDQDDDGFTVAEGDCDDTNVYASPAREEDKDDGIDNDCDGRLDEEWSGLDVAYANDDGSSSIFHLDTIGRVQDEQTVDNDCYPVWLDHEAGPLSDGTDGWVINNGYAKVSTVDRDGTCTDLFDFSEDTDAYPYGVYGIATGLDGTIYATTLGGLQAISPDGTVSEVATWTCDLYSPDDHEIAVYSLAVDPLTGEVGLFGYFGGFATYDPTSGAFALLAKEDLEAPVVYTYSGAHKDGDGWYSPGIDANSGAYYVYRFNIGDAGWVAQEEWADEDWEPFMLAIDGDTGDYYVTANAGWFYTVWRVVAGSGYAADLYTSDGTVPHRGFYGIVTTY